MFRFEIIAFDADDTLWHNETIFHAAQERFRALLGTYAEPDQIDGALHEREMSNLELFGYGVKGFALSMIETAIQLSGGKVTGSEVQTIVDLARTMLSAEVELIDGVAETVSKLSKSHRLMLITKGDLHDQELKVERSGLARFFWQIEIVSDKNRDSYGRVLQRHGIAPSRFLMVGNSIRSDILPVLELGATAVYVPYHLTWAHEVADPPTDHPGFYEVEQSNLLPALVESIEKSRRD